MEKHDSAWPKWKYHKDGRSKVIHSSETEKQLGEDWKDSPADHGVITYPHSDEYEAERLHVKPDGYIYEGENDGDGPVHQDPPAKGRKPKKG